MDQQDPNLIEIEDFFQFKGNKDAYPIYLNSPQQVFNKLDCLITLGEEFGLDDEENALSNIHLEQPEMKDFHLEKYFNEQKPMEYIQKQPQEIQHEGRVRMNRKESAQLPSFIEELDLTVQQMIEKLGTFQEQNKYQESINNIDNFTYLEQAMKVPQAFQSFYPHYIRILQKIKSYKQQNRLDVKQLISFVCSIGVELVREVLNLILKADSAWCFETMKSVESAPIMQKQQQQQLQEIAQVNQISHDQSVESLEKKGRKAWTAKELQYLQTSINQYQNGNIPNSAMIQLSKQLGRSWCSVQSKVQKLRKTQADMSDIKSLSSVSKQDIKGGRSTKYDYTVEEMIRMALQQLQGRGTKQQIISQISYQLFNGQLAEDSSLFRSIAITLSSNRSQFIRKVKGTFGLTQYGNDMNDEENSIKSQLAQMIRSYPKQKATIAELIETCCEGCQDQASLKRLKKTISQTLLQCTMFDKSNAKTVYVLEQ